MTLGRQCWVILVFVSLFCTSAGQAGKSGFSILLEGEQAREVFAALTVPEEKLKVPLSDQKAGVELQVYKVGRNVLCVKRSQGGLTGGARTRYFCSMGMSQVGEVERLEISIRDSSVRKCN